MSSTLILISLMLALSVAVIFPEFQYSNSSKVKNNNEFDYMVNKQRKGFLILGLAAISTFFVSIQILSVPLFVMHLVLDVLFGIYAYIAFQVRADSIQRKLVENNLFESEVIEPLEYLKQAG